MSARIIIVEDEAAIALDLTKILRANGYRVLGCASSADQAFKLIDEACSKQQAPDAAMIDVKLLAGADGFSVAEYLHQKCGSDVAIIFATGLGDEETAKHAEQVGAFACLVKPFDEHQLLVSLRNALTKHQRPQQHRNVQATSSSQSDTSHFLARKEYGSYDFARRMPAPHADVSKPS